MSAQGYVVSVIVSWAIACGSLSPAVAQVPDNLNPYILQLSTKPEEVKIQGNQPITLEQAVELAKRNNLELQRALLQIERSRAALREVQAGMYPTVNLSADVTRSLSAASELSTQQLRQQSQFAFDRSSNFNQSADTITSFSGTAQLTYGLYNFGPGGSSRAAAEEQVRVSELGVERTSEDIRLNVTQNYYDLQEADENVRIQQSAVENAQASLLDAQALERAGVGTRFDVLGSQVNLANAQQNLTNAISSQIIARRRLATILNIPQSINVSAADSVQLAGLWNQTLEQSIVLAYQNRPELQQRLAERTIAQKRERVALSGLKPQLNFFANYDLLDVFNDNTRVSDGYAVGVQGRWTLFDGGRARARAEQENINMRISEVQFTETRNNIRFQVEEAYATQQSNLENVQTANAALEQAKEALRYARLRFQAGVGTQTDVINAENDLTQAEGNRIRAILDYNRAIVQLQRFVTFRALTK